MSAIGNPSTKYLSGGTPARLFLSLIVVFSHFGSLTGLYRNRNLLDADFAVECFFILSGYAMMHSYAKFFREKGGNTAFYVQRFYRIVVTVFFLVVLQVAIMFSLSAFSWRQYFGKDLLAYFFANISLLNFLKQTLPGVFLQNASQVVNGSLWTMKVEMSYYLLFPLLYFAMQRKYIWMFVVLAASVCYRVFLADAHPTLSYQLPGQLYYFVAGMLLYHFHSREFSHWLVTVFGLIFFVKNSIWGYSFLESAFTFPLIVLAFTNLLSPLDKWLKAHDYSFTLYLLHWPIIQSANHLFLNQGNIPGGIIFTICVLATGSFLFKKYVEDATTTAGKSLSMRVLRKNNSAAKATIPS